VLELTEHASVGNYGRLADALDPLRVRGVRVAVDDAGAGFASFRHILNLNPDIIKLDMALTRGIQADPVRRALASALVTFARELHAVIVAEGIETEAELKALRSLGVGYGQGFFLARPGSLPLGRITAFSLTDGPSSHRL
jgi:EAL domain-containing protein (putative c-di-GMP-specific phosphodiesterase class I)